MTYTQILRDLLELQHKYISSIVVENDGGGVNSELQTKNHPNLHIYENYIHWEIYEITYCRGFSA